LQSKKGLSIWRTQASKACKVKSAGQTKTIQKLTKFYKGLAT
jgi:hypothetical protein